jgi:asparagine synthase (glutamine-hydrolysing)
MTTFHVTWDEAAPRVLARGLDAASLAAADAQWGSALPEHLEGDFAYALWDPVGRELRAGRAALGGEALFYTLTRGGIALAGEVGPLVELPGVSRELEDGVVRDYLEGDWRHQEETFFRAVKRLPPGHRLTATERGVSVVRWFQPPPERRVADAPGELRDLLRRSIAASLRGEACALVHLSGGLDSSSIACLAATLPRGETRVVLGSAVFPGLSCDESAFIDAVARDVPFTSERHDVTREPDAEPPFFRDHPWRAPSPDNQAGWRRQARREGARVVLSGRGGDELLFERGVFRDLAAHGRFLRLRRETRDLHYSAHDGAFFLRDALVATLPPALKRAFRRVIPRRREPEPAWLGPKLRALSRETAPAPLAFASHTQEATWAWLTGAPLLWAVEAERLVAARAGLEVRYPFLDASLARFVLALPYEARLPGGLMKRLLRDALGTDLPREIAFRTEVTTFEDLLRLQVERSLPRIRAVLTRGPWASEPWVERAGALALMDAVDSGRTRDADDARLLWDMAMLEEWLRRL